jgi:hypothetical protein
MGGITVGIGAAFLLSVVLQVAVLSMLPITRGYTVPLYTAIAVVAINIAVFIFARIANAGVHLSLLIPLSATFVPLGVIAISIFAYGEPMPIAKAGLLVAACLLIGAASAIR